MTLAPRVDEDSAIVGDEEYVYFGKFEHRLEKYNGGKEPSATPILWRVMELQDHDGDKPGAILLSHYLLEAMAYQGTIDGSNPYYRPGTSNTIFANVWSGSEVQTWLNSASDDVTVKLGATDANADIKGFLHTDYFSSPEQSSMVDYPYGSHGETETSPADGLKVALPSETNVLSFELAAWFGGTINNARKAHFKDGPSSFTEGQFDGWYYWTRSPVASDSVGAWVVGSDGTLDRGDVIGTWAAARPAFFLNLESAIFKSASDVSNPAAEGGKISNPYILYLTSADKAPQSADVSGDRLTVTFAAADSVVHAYTDTPNAAELAKRFAVTASGGAVTASSATVSGSAVAVTLSRAVSSDETVTVAYAHTAGCSDGLAFLSDATALKSFAAMVAKNNTQALDPNGPADPTDPTDPVDATEKIFFSALAGACEIRYISNADGTTTVHVLIPAASGSDLSLLASVRAVFDGFTGYTNVEYFFVGEGGNETPIPALNEASARGAVSPPYLKIAFDLPAGFDLSSLDSAAIEKIFYTLKNDAVEYAQTFAGGLKFAAMQRATSTGGSGGVGCGTGTAALIAVLSCAAFAMRKKIHAGK